MERAVTLSFGDHEAKLWRAETLLALGRREECLRALQEIPADGARALALYILALRGLALAGLGDEAGLLEQARALPAPVAKAVREWGAIPDDRSPDTARRLLEGMLAMARGVRRGDGVRAWLGSDWPRP